MNADEIVRALKSIARNCDGSHSCWHSPTLKKAVDLIESLQAQLAEYDESAAEYGIDGKTMLTLAKSQIKTAQDNIKLQEQLAASQRRERAAVEGMQAESIKRGMIENMILLKNLGTPSM